MLAYLLYRERQVQRQFSKWGWERPSQQIMPSIINDEVLISKVEMLWRKNFTHSRMLRALNEFEGYPNLSGRQLKKLQHRNRFLWASRSNVQKEIAQEAAREEVEKQLKIGQSTRYGKVIAWTNVRRFSKVFISRDTITKVTSEIDPEGVLYCRAEKL